MNGTTSRCWILALVAIACGGDDGGSGTLSSSSNATATVGTTDATTASATDTSTMGTSASTTATTDPTATDPTATTTPTTGPGESSTAMGSSGADSSSDGGSGSDTSGTCVAEQGSCLRATCCGELSCCSGVPIPQGQAICYATCPDSDRNLKHRFAAVDVDAVLERVANLPVTTWSYLGEPGEVRHIGPMAQDFQAAFAVGASDRAIAKVDADGVALASVQALHRRVAALQDENAELRATLAAVHGRLTALERR